MDRKGRHEMDPRQRTGRLLFGGAALGATGYFTGLAVAPLAAEDLTGAVTWSGLPGAMGIVGTALGATLVTSLLRRLGRRRGLTAGYVLAVVGALLAVVAMRAGMFPLLLVGTTLFGVGHAANQLTRYVVAELHEPDRRGRALGWIVWAGTIGGVVGPNLLAPSGRVAVAAGLPELAGPYVVGVLAMAAVAVGYQVVLRPDPGSLAVSETLDEGPTGEGATASAWRLPTVRVAVAVMVTGQVVMVWLMSMTPVHIRESGGDLGRIGLILSAHIFGMYALAPVAGWVEDRFGSLSAIATALAGGGGRARRHQPCGRGGDGRGAVPARARLVVRLRGREHPPGAWGARGNPSGRPGARGDRGLPRVGRRVVGCRPAARRGRLRRPGSG